MLAAAPAAAEDEEEIIIHAHMWLKEKNLEVHSPDLSAEVVQGERGVK